MIRFLPLFGIAAALAVGGCGKSGSDSLNEAAAQSDPAAAVILRNEARTMDEDDTSLSAPNSAAQQALENAGDAAAADVNRNAGE